MKTVEKIIIENEEFKLAELLYILTKSQAYNLNVKEQIVKFRLDIEKDAKKFLKYSNEEYIKITCLLNDNEFENVFIRSATLSQKLISSRVAILKPYIRTSREESYINNLVLNNSVQDKLTLIQNRKKYVWLDRADPIINNKLKNFEELISTLNVLIMLRNQYIHSYIHISKELAVQSFKILKLNLDNYKQDWERLR